MEPRIDCPCGLGVEVALRARVLRMPGAHAIPVWACENAKQQRISPVVISLARKHRRQARIGLCSSLAGRIRRWANAMVLLPLLRPNERHWQPKSDNEAIDRTRGGPNREHRNHALFRHCADALDEHVCDDVAGKQITEAV
jgi:hypothetical protein